MYNLIFNKKYNLILHKKYNLIFRKKYNLILRKMYNLKSRSKSSQKHTSLVLVKPNASDKASHILQPLQIFDYILR